MESNSRYIFYENSGYPIQRNIVDVPLERYIPKKKIGLSKVVSHISYKMGGSSQLLDNSHWELLKKSNGLWHFFNSVSFGKTPWVVTYETALPRWNTAKKSVVKYGVKALASKPCKRLIAMSECTKDIQVRYLEKEFPSFKSQITPKIAVVHPPQPLLINSLSEKHLPEDKLIFTVIGADFFRKGGKEILHVFKRLFSENAPIELNIISTLQFGDYASKTSKKDLLEAKKIISKFDDKIHHYNRLPNKKVLEILKNSHVGLLPTYGDTYGYSVLEAQACGCPVITTNIRTLPEINNNNCGWIIKVPKNDRGDGLLDTEQQRAQFSAVIQEQLFKIIHGLISNSNQISAKGRCSLARIGEYHNPVTIANEMEQIYDEALR